MIKNEDMREAQEVIGGIVTHDAHSDGAYMVPVGECAVHTTDGMKGLALIIPKALTPQQSADVPELMLALTAVMVRLDRDPEFRREQIEWMHGHRS